MLRILQFNAFTLCTRARREVVAKQLDTLNIAIAGFQETRTRHRSVREELGFIVAASGSHAALGCEIWLSVKNWTFEQRRVRVEDVAILDAGPRHLIIKVNCALTPFAIVCAHSLTAGAEEALVGEWWADMAARCREAAQGCPILMAIDANSDLNAAEGHGQQHVRRPARAQRVAARVRACFGE